MTGWILDSSTFIHALTVSHEALLPRLRSRVWFIEYVFQVELTGDNAHPPTRYAALRDVGDGKIGIARLTIDDLVRMSTLAAPRRRVDVGELGTAVVADRLGAGVLCDDRRAVDWMQRHLENVPAWESIEHVLVDAAFTSVIAEHHLPGLQNQLEAANYRCAFNLHHAYGQRWLGQRGTPKDGEPPKR